MAVSRPAVWLTPIFLFCSLLLSQALGSTEVSGTIEIGLHSKGDAAIEGDVYVGVVASDGSAKSPLHETVGMYSGKPIRWEVAGGEFTVLCSAVGHGLAVLSARVQEGSTTVVECVLDTLPEYSGRVISVETGRAFGGATVAPLKPGRAGSWARLSTLANEHLQRKSVAVTNRDGEFVVKFAADEDTRLVIEAPACATLAIDLGLAQGSSTKLGDIYLHPGGALDVFVDVRNPGGGSDLTLSLAEYSPKMGNRGYVEKLKKTIFRGTVDDGGLVEWKAIPVGVYSIFLEEATGPRLVGYANVSAGTTQFVEVSVTDAVIDVEVLGLSGGLERNSKIVVWNAMERIHAKPIPDSSDGDEDSAWFRASVRWPGQYAISVEGQDGYGAAWGGTIVAADVPRIGGAVSTRVDLEARGGEMTGVVVDTAYVPVDKATVSVTDAQRNTLCRATTDEAGRWVCPWVPNSDLGIIAWKDNVGVSEILSAEGSQGHISLVLKTGRLLSGCLTAPYGETVSRAKVGFVNSKYQGLYFSTSTDQDGRFVLSNLPFGEALVMVVPKNPDLAFVSAEISDDFDGDLGCLESTVGGTAMAPGPRAGVSWEGTLRSSVVSNGKPLGDLGARMVGAACLAPDLSCILRRLPPGRHQVRWFDGSGVLVAKTSEFLVGSNETVVFDTEVR